MLVSITILQMRLDNNFSFLCVKFEVLIRISDGCTVCACVLSLFSHVRLFATPWTVACQAPPSIGFFKHEYRSGLPFPSPGDLPNPGIELGSPALQADAKKKINNSPYRDFPGDPVVKNPPANAGGLGSIPGPGRSHMLWGT